MLDNSARTTNKVAEKCAKEWRRNIIFLHSLNLRGLPETWQNPYQKCDLIGKIALTPSLTRVCGHQTLQGFGHALVCVGTKPFRGLVLHVCGNKPLQGVYFSASSRREGWPSLLAHQTPEGFGPHTCVCTHTKPLKGLAHTHEWVRVWEHICQLNRIFDRDFAKFPGAVVQKNSTK